MHYLYYVVDLNQMKILKIFRKKREAQWYTHETTMSSLIFSSKPRDIAIIRGIL